MIFQLFQPRLKYYRCPIRLLKYLRLSNAELIKINALSKAELVPRKYVDTIPKDRNIQAHIQWLVQKFILGQDMYLVGSPGPLRRRLALACCEMLNREVEILTLSQDTTEGDLKQRREILNGSAFFVDQAPVRAALKV